jgi:choloylglycine hydrolase
VDTLPSIDVVSLGTDAPCLHWRISEPCGRIVILEFIAGEPHFYEDSTGVLTNGPGFQWQRANLYDTSSFVPGDSASQSRFVRATYMQAGSPEMRTGPDAIQQAFHILNNFDVPVGIQYAISETAEVLPSATQIISATDQTSLKPYYRTVWNSTIRCIELMNIDFAKVRYQSHPLDRVMQPVVEIVKVK